MTVPVAHDSVKWSCQKKDPPGGRGVWLENLPAGGEGEIDHVTTLFSFLGGFFFVADLVRIVPGILCFDDDHRHDEKEQDHHSFDCSIHGGLLVVSGLLENLELAGVLIDHTHDGFEGCCEAWVFALDHCLCQLH